MDVTALAEASFLGTIATRCIQMGHQIVSPFVGITDEFKVKYAMMEIQGITLVVYQTVLESSMDIFVRMGHTHIKMTVNPFVEMGSRCMMRTAMMGLITQRGAK